MLETRDTNGCRILRLAHGKVNALDSELFAALDSALDEARESSVAALVLTGTGGVFSAGVDLHRVLAGGGEYLDQFLPALSAGLERLFAFPKPVVAALNGHAIAGGYVLALAADLRIAADSDARVGLPELKVGVPFPVAALEVVRFGVGGHKLAELALGGRTYPLAKAAELGLVDRVVPAEQLLDEALEAATELAAIPPEVFALNKRQLRQATCARIEREAPRTDSETLTLWKQPATHEAIRAYLERTIRR